MVSTAISMAPGAFLSSKSNNSTGTVLYLHHDQQGAHACSPAQPAKRKPPSPTTPTATRLAVREQAQHRWATTANTPTPIQGFIYLRAREYDPATGQFMSVDPKIESTQEAYAYAANDPVAQGDPRGMAPNVACRTVNSPCGEQEAREELERRRTKHTEAELEGAFATILRYFNIPTPARDVGYDLEPVRNRNGITIREPGTTGQANTIRIMFGDKANPDGSAVIYDEYGKPIDYRTGKEPATRADWHIPGGNKVPVQGLPPWRRGE